MKRWEVSNGDVTEKSLKCEGCIMAASDAGLLIRHG
jgi:hypothetical protein